MISPGLSQTPPQLFSLATKMQVLQYLSSTTSQPNTKSRTRTLCHISKEQIHPPREGTIPNSNTNTATTQRKIATEPASFLWCKAHTLLTMRLGELLKETRLLVQVLLTTVLDLVTFIMVRKRGTCIGNKTFSMYPITHLKS